MVNGNNPMSWPKMKDEMTLRDLFAAAALAGYCTREFGEGGFLSIDERAKAAFLQADAMLRERGKGESGE